MRQFSCRTGSDKADRPDKERQANMARTLSGTFKVDEVNGTKVNKEFPFDWREKDLLDLVNSHEKASAKAKEYQEVTKPYRPDPKDPAVKRDQLIKNLVSMGVSKDIATQQIDAMLAASV